MMNASQGKFSSMENLPTMRLTLLNLFIFQHLFSICVTSYKPIEDIAINCGSSVNSNTRSRNWTGDANPNPVSLIEQQKDRRSTAANTSPFPTAIDPIIYGTARLSRSVFIYSFPVIDGQKFVRLHFFPASYATFGRSNSLFSVTAGRFTLLKHFNASLTADNDETVTREYIINVEPGQRLNITFTPSVGIHPDAYAFINAIEVVSMPNYLYFTKPDDLIGFEMVGEHHQSRVDNKSALEKVYGVNVGVKQIGAGEDTGMFRSWDDDTHSLERWHPEQLAFVQGREPLYTETVPNYTAPDEVYLTGRTYGKNPSDFYNLTWHFEVDLGFNYMVRLHFCELDELMKDRGYRVFKIFIADILAEEYADVVGWSGGFLVPYYKDYGVHPFRGESLKRVNLTIKLEPYRNQKISVYEEVILNGIEIFKVSQSLNLAGPNPDPRPLDPLSRVPEPNSSGSSKKKKQVITGVVGGGVFGFIVLSVTVFLIFRQRTLKDRNSRQALTSLAMAKSSKTRGSSSLPSDLCRYFSIGEIRAATNNFDDIFIIGTGGFGDVYKGYIDDGIVPVAIKRLKPGSQQGVHEFQTEIEMLSQLRHLHLVSLIGYCNDGNEMILVYDFMARGTLRDHLYDSDNEPLLWKQRLEICLGAARGLHYLHTGAKHNIIHRDVKTTNILLDEKWVAKVSDFGLSKIGPTGMSKSHISTIVKGSLGYLDPEYYKRQRLTQKSDVYSFGVVLLEVLCGRPPLLRTVDKQQASLVEWIRKCHASGEIDHAVDLVLRESIKAECLKKFIELSLSCLLEDGNERPSMGDVVWGLEFALQLQESKEERQDEGKCEERSLLPRQVMTDEEYEVQFTSTDGSVTESKSSKVTNTSNSSEDNSLLVSRKVFSELWDPRAR